MIFVTIGMYPEGFKRLVKQMDQVASRMPEEKVVMQIAGTKYVPEHARYFDYATEQELNELYREARVVVTHGGATILDILQQGKPAIVVPRLKRYGEAIDDHQLYLARELEQKGKIIAVYNVDDLEEALKKMELRSTSFTRDRRLITAIKKYVAQFDDRCRC